MRVKKVSFVLRKIEKDPIEYGNINSIEIIFSNDCINPVINVDVGNLLVTDKTFCIDVKEIMEKIGKIDFDAKYDVSCPEEFSGESWELSINDNSYKGIMVDPHYVVKIKKIIRLDVIQEQISRKIAAYLKCK